ncbi:hypothetical protein EVAR_99689_1 [Eumeta japonica]|uniref:CUB domain-containing protein n=1 Tax=Eumeta variegata TaxID=151549 RepID=A0A4C1YIN4_EUMVA|nr:hypothetical protein EVAR_99689_1 [Eumeta japonica]
MNQNRGITSVEFGEIRLSPLIDLVSVHYCNREVHVSESGVASEGYVRTPGYPHFYAGGTCRWRITANPEQRLRITLLDVSLRSIGPFESECTDYVEILEANGARVLSTCDQPELPLQLTSASSQLDVLVVARSLGAFPKRGVLLHYKSNSILYICVGCVTLSPPSDGYRVYRDGELAHYMCNINYVFADSQQRARLLKCYDDNIWNDTLSPCIKYLRACGACRVTPGQVPGVKDTFCTGPGTLCALAATVDDDLQPAEFQ